MAIRASTSVQLDTEALPQASFASLKDAGGALASDLLAKVMGGQLVAGDMVRTGKYYADGVYGGATYLLASGSGVDDGGSVINVATLHLQAVFDTGHFDVCQFGARGDDATDDTAPINAAIAYGATYSLGNFGDGRAATLHVPPGKYRTSAWVGYEATTDGNLGLTITGAADGVTSQIRAFGQSHPVMRFATTFGNFRGLRVENIMLRNGSIALDLDRVKYSNFYNLTTFQQGELALRVNNGGLNLFESVNFTQTVNDTMELIGGTGDQFADCLYGELAGNIMVNGTHARLSGGTFFGSYDRREPTGYQGMGPAMFTVRGGGSLTVSDAELWPYENLANVENHQSLVFEGCRIEWDSDSSHDGHLIKMDTSAQGGTTSLRNCEVVLSRGAPFSTMKVFEDFGTGGKIQNSSLVNVHFRVQTGNVVMIDDQFNDPELGNVLTGNTYYEGAVV